MRLQCCVLIGSLITRCPVQSYSNRWWLVMLLPLIMFCFFAVLFGIQCTGHLVRDRNVARVKVGPIPDIFILPRLSLTRHLDTIAVAAPPILSCDCQVYQLLRKFLNGYLLLLLFVYSFQSTKVLACALQTCAVASHNPSAFQHCELHLARQGSCCLAALGHGGGGLH